MKKCLPFLLLTILWSSGLFAQTLISATLLGSRTKAQIAAQSGVPLVQYGAKFYRLLYTTTAINGTLDTASGLLAVPDNLTKVYPRLVYQHGTSGSRFDVPSYNATTGEGLLSEYYWLGWVSSLWLPIIWDWVLPKVFIHTSTRPAKPPSRLICCGLSTNIRHRTAFIPIRNFSSLVIRKAATRQWHCTGLLSRILRMNLRLQRRHQCLGRTAFPG